jgi:hypothetical protein
MKILEGKRVTGRTNYNPVCLKTSRGSKFTEPNKAFDYWEPTVIAAAFVEARGAAERSTALGRCTIDEGRLIVGSTVESIDAAAQQSQDALYSPKARTVDAARWGASFARVHREDLKHPLLG